MRERTITNMPERAEFYRILLGKMRSQARKWDVAIDDVTAIFFQSTDTRSNPVNYEVRGPGEKRQFFRDGKEANMPRLRVIKSPPHSFDDIREKMEACPDYAPPRFAVA